MLDDYFSTREGTGILATADSSGAVNAAVYGKPHVVDDTTIAFIMAQRRTHHNLQTNPSACYLFRESGEGYRGKRLYLTKTREDSDPALINAMRRSVHGHGKAAEGKRYLVYFRVDTVLPLIGTGESPDEGR